MSERDERTTSATGRDGSDAEQTSVLTDLRARYAGEADGGRGGDGAPPPPWQRGTAGRSEHPDRTQALDVGEPLHVTRSSGAVSADEPEQGAAGPWDAPTGFVAPVGESQPDGEDAGTAVFRRPRHIGPDAGSSGRPAADADPASTVRNRVPRRANLTLKGFDPWSVLKLSLVLSIVGFVVWMIAVMILYGVLDGMGVWDQVNTTYAGLTQGGSDENIVSFGTVFTAAAVIGLINIVLFTAFATVAAYIYNLAADMVGGTELTLSERD